MTQIRPIQDKWWESSPVAEDAGSGDGDAWWQSSPEAPDRPALLGGPGATMGPEADDGQGLARVWQEAGRKLKEAIFGHPDRAEAEASGIYQQPTPAKLAETALAGGAAMAGGAGAGSLAAHPFRAGMAMAGSYAGEKAGSKAGSVAESMGAPGGTARVLGIAGAVAGGGMSGSRRAMSKAMDALEVASPARAAAVRRLMGSAGAEAAPVAEAAAAKVSPMPAAPSAAVTQAAEIEERIVALRSKSGLSGAQITSAIRQLYPGYRPSEYQKMVDMVLRAHFSQGTK